MSAIATDITRVPKAKNSITKSFLTEQKDRYHEMVLNVKRRNVNKPEKLLPVLHFLTSSVKRYDNIVFVKSNEKDIEKLYEVGFVKESRCRFDKSLHTMFWEEFMLEFEIVAEQDWNTLLKCVELSNLTGYYNLNNICSVLDSGVA